MKIRIQIEGASVLRDHSDPSGNLNENEIGIDSHSFGHISRLTTTEYKTEKTRRRVSERGEGRGEREEEREGGNYKERRGR